MNVRELIEKLGDFDPDLEVKIEGFKSIDDVDTAIERDPFDGDFDNTIVLISWGEAHGRR